MFRFKIPVFARVIFLVGGFLLVLLLFMLWRGGRLSTSSKLREVNPVCDATLWNHVYHPSRLEVKDPCIRVTGVIQKIRVEKDGDYHVELRLDPAYRHLLNDANSKNQRGNLVVEPICQRKVTQENAKEACRGFNKFMKIPPVGTRVTVEGSYVLDTHHGWMEIHPATRIVPIP
ncbi:MAG: hypothetical protein Q7R73_04095 [bacterium]|nr:hypothetical protein [bacterium]